jgi:adenylate cyclase
LIDQVRFGLAIYNFTAAQIQSTRRLGEQLLGKAQAHNDPIRFKLAYHLLGVTSFHLGQMNEARHHLEQAIAYHAPEQVLRQIPDPTIINVLFLALARGYLGYPDRARQTIEEAFSLAETLSDPMAKVWSHAWAAWLYQSLEQPDKTEQHAQAGLAISLEHGLGYGEILVTLFRSWVAVRQTQTEAEIGTYRQGVADFMAAGARIQLGYFQFLLADLYRVTGQFERGLETLEAISALMDQTGDRFIEAEVYRLRAELRLAQSSDNQLQAEADFQQALTVARKQQTRFLELRAALGLARLWQQQGKNNQAHALLSEIYGWFTEGFDTPDLQAARQLLTQLCP